LIEQKTETPQVECVAYSTKAFEGKFSNVNVTNETFTSVTALLESKNYITTVEECVLNIKISKTHNGDALIEKVVQIVLEC
jgi:hypothetical protein